MNCPFKNSPVPPCSIAAHPDRNNIEYCRVCGEWVNLTYVGDEFPNLFWLFVAIAIVMMVFIGLIEDAARLRIDNFDRYPGTYQNQIID